MLEVIRSEMFNEIVLCVNIIMLTAVILFAFRLRKINKNYKYFMNKLGKGENLDEMLKGYITQVTGVERKYEELKASYHGIEKDLKTCIQKVGMVRYNAFKDTGSDLSFTLALLDDNNDGVVLNGIYSREMSNIYAKQVNKGQAVSKISEEEKEAIYMAINQAKDYKLKN